MLQKLLGVSRSSQVNKRLPCPIVKHYFHQGSFLATKDDLQSKNVKIKRIHVKGRGAASKARRAIDTDQNATDKALTTTDKVQSATDKVRGANGKAQSAIGKRAISILEELFPQSTFQKTMRTKVKPKRLVPKIALDLPLSTDGPGNIEPPNAITTPPIDQKARHNRNTALLILRKASKFLTKADFRRVMPGARHIEGWTQQGNILNIIRGRDVATLHPNGSYILIFENPASAQAYKEHVQRLHRLSKSYLPGVDNFSGAIPPPPSISSDGRLTYTHETYALLPPSHELDIPMMVQPFSPLLRQVVDRSGYSPLVDGRRSEHEVLLGADWMQLSISALSRAIAADGKRRGIHWAAISNRTAIRDLKLSPTGNAEHMFDQASAKNELRGSSNPLRSDGLKRFIVSFLEDAEAKRFALAWNQRDITALLESAPPDRERIMTQAELIW